MTADDVAAQTEDLPGGPVMLLQTELVMKRLPHMSGALQIAFTPNGVADIPWSKELSDVQAARHAENSTAPIGDPVYVNVTALAFDAGAWHDMGEPDVITLTVRPGDQLTPDHGLSDLGPVREVQHIPGKGDSVAAVLHRPLEDDRPQHDDVTNDDVRETVVDPPPAEAMAALEVEVPDGEARSV